MSKIALSLITLLFLSTAAAAQLTLPRISQRQEVVQTVGDTKLTVNHGQPNVRDRKVWGALVPFGQVWRAGSDENTTFETSRDVTINGKPLPAGKYGFHVIPAETEWTIVFSKASDQWGSFNYDPKLDALRLSLRPNDIPFAETVFFNFTRVTVSTTVMELGWEKLGISLAVDTGDVHGRSLAAIREAIKKRAADDVRPYSQGAGYVWTFRLEAAYPEAVSWIDEALKPRETFALLSSKSRILAAMGKKAEAIAAGERALEVGKAATPPANTAAFERELAALKASK
jgi:hypothetical protein